MKNFVSFLAEKFKGDYTRVGNFFFFFFKKFTKNSEIFSTIFLHNKTVWYKIGEIPKRAKIKT